MFPQNGEISVITTYDWVLRVMVVSEVSLLKTLARIGNKIF